MKPRPFYLIIGISAFILGGAVTYLWNVSRTPVLGLIDIAAPAVDQVTSVPVAQMTTPEFDPNVPFQCALWPESRITWTDEYDTKPPCRICSGRAIMKPAPIYPEAAKKAKIAGLVTVRMVISEKGRPETAEAVSGHGLLREAAVKAACRARFRPTLLTGQKVKVTGVITYQFVLP